MRYNVTYIFDEEKATQAAAFLLNKAPDRKLNYTKLVKLLYISDRTFILKYHDSITTDIFFSLDNGPITSTILDLIKNYFSKEDENLGLIWQKYIEKKNYDVLLKEIPDFDLLSNKEKEILSDVFDRFKNFDYSEMIEYCHKNFPEWHDPHGSRMPIPVESILETELSDEELNSALEEMQQFAMIQRNNYIMLKDNS